jgi:hypothetical protein
MRRPVDTSPEARRRQVGTYRSMTPNDRLRLADEMSTEIRLLAVSGIRSRHPEYSPGDEAAALAQLLLRPRGPAGTL